MLVVSVGFDKSDSDFGGTRRPCNRRNDNSALFAQTFACLAGPVSEDYDNEVATLEKSDYPIKDTIQRLVDDSLYALVVTERDCSKDLVTACSCFIFQPVSTPPPGTKRPLQVELLPVMVSDSVAFSDEDIIKGSPVDMPDVESGKAHTLHLPPSEKVLSISLVTSVTNTSTVVGFRVFVKDEFISTHKLHYSFKLQQPMNQLSLNAINCLVNCPIMVSRLIF